MPGSSLLKIVLIAGLAAGFSSLQAARYTIAVNAGTTTGSWNRFYERCIASDHMHTAESTAYGRNTSNALIKAHAESGFQYVRGHGIFDDDVAIYSEDSSGTAVYTWTNLDKIYDTIVAAGMRPMVEIGFMPKALASSTSLASGGSSVINSVWYNGFDPYWNAPKDWNKWKALVGAFVTHLETRYGKADVESNWYFELWNEPNWMYGGGGGDNGYLRLYDSTAVAVKATDSLVKLGGPAENGGTSQSFIPTFIRHCKTYNRKLDFVTYHTYANDNGVNDSAPTANNYHKQISDSCRNNSFTGKIICSEWGPSYTQGLALHDNETAASFVAKVVCLLNSNDTVTYPPPYMNGLWAISDLYEETNNTASSNAFCGCYGLMTRGDPAIPQSWDVPKPIFNAYILLSRLGASKLSCTGGTTASPGVNAVATMSATDDTVDVLLYSHVDNANGNSATMDSVTLNITMPTGWTNVVARHWVVDRTHSNSYQTWVGLGSPKTPTAAQWTTIANAGQLAYYDSAAAVTVTGGVYTKTFTQNYYSVGLIQLTRGTTAVAPAINKTSSRMNFSAVRIGNELALTLPSEGRYTVQLYTTGGRRIFESTGRGTGTVAVALPRLPAGVLILRCSGEGHSIVRQIMARP